MKIADFLVEVAKSDAELAAFRANPKEKMKKAGLTTRQQRVILSGDVLRIKHVIDYESGEGGLMIVCTHYAPPP